MVLVSVGKWWSRAPYAGKGKGCGRYGWRWWVYSREEERYE